LLVMEEGNECRRFEESRVVGGLVGDGGVRGGTRWSETTQRGNEGVVGAVGDKLGRWWKCHVEGFRAAMAWWAVDADNATQQ
jgi:hypothetical protein